MIKDLAKTYVFIGKRMPVKDNSNGLEISATGMYNIKFNGLNPRNSCRVGYPGENVNLLSNKFR